MSTSLVVAQERPAEEWDQFVQTCPGWTSFHLSAWEQTYRIVLAHETVYLTARSGGAGGALRGVLPLVRVRSRLFGHFLVSLPFVNHGGPLGSDEAIQALVNEAIRIATRDRVDLLELRSRRALPIALAVSHRKVGVLLDLPPTAEALFKSFPAKLRSQIRRPQKDGVVVRAGHECLDDFHAVFAAHMRDLGTPTHGQRVFKDLAQRLDHAAWVKVAYLDDRPIACGMGFRWHDEFEITWASSLRAYNRVAPNMLLYWDMLQQAISEGCTRFNFGRSTPGASTHRFKLQWGGYDEPLHWYQFSTTGETATPSPDDGMLSLGPKIWRSLPLAFTNRVGPHVVRLIP